MGRLALATALLLMVGAAAAQNRPATTAVVFFDWGKEEARRDDNATLDRVAEAWRARPAARLQLAGHTDRSGDKETNQATGLRRAASIGAELQTRGIPLNAMRFVSFGEDQLQVPTEDGVREVQNRRVVISFEE